MEVCLTSNLFLLYLSSDDITLDADGKDTYRLVKDAGRYRYVDVRTIYHGLTSHASGSFLPASIVSEIGRRSD